MRRWSRPFTIFFGVLVLLIIAAVGPFFPSQSIVYPTEVSDAPPVRRAPREKAKLPENLERYLPRETSPDTSSFQASALGSVESLVPDPDIITKAKAFVDTHDLPESSHREFIDRGFQQYLGRSPSDSEAQAGLQTLRDYLSH